MNSASAFTSIQVELSLLFLLLGATAARVTDSDADELIRLSANVRELWNAKTTTNEDRKRLLRTVLSEVIVKAISSDALDVELVWVAGLRSPLRVPRISRPGRHAS